jgi:hypothetical protein
MPMLPPSVESECTAAHIVRGGCDVAIGAGGLVVAMTYPVALKKNLRCDVAIDAGGLA